MHPIYYKGSHQFVPIISPASSSIMLVILIPFFLVGRIPIEKDVWSPNLEYNFKLNISQIERIESDTYLYSSVTANLLCRPRKSDVLSCVMENPLIRNEETKIANAGESYLEYFGKWVYFDQLVNPRFEIVFDKNGAKSLVVSRNASANLNLYRTIANQLSIGTVLEHRMSGDFSAVENSTVGQCEVLYRINKDGKMIHAERTEPTFTLVSIANNHKPRGKVIEIEKHRNLSNCQINDIYLFETSKKHSAYKQKLESHVKNYSSTFYISDTVFRSESHADTELTDNEKKVGTVELRIILALERIKILNSEIPEVEDPITVGVIGENFTKKSGNNIEIHETSTESEETESNSKTTDNE
ncbi:uncharacterized protein LOC107274230 [Cephus cinctus]|uniref:Uncharacterized protein LOC107274230 n=1 Tax=Cephus cinctus TaxID=211228 RepID=A0AAJ7CF12_CEPCN|nr:uncharacterized protein LOC107274230 [Cephus cinctus]